MLPGISCVLEDLRDLLESTSLKFESGSKRCEEHIVKPQFLLEARPYLVRFSLKMDKGSCSSRSLTSRISWPIQTGRNIPVYETCIKKII